MRLGDCVELAPGPGEEDVRLGRVEALWEEKYANGTIKPWLRVRRYFRPHVGGGRAHGGPGLFPCGLGLPLKCLRSLCRGAAGCAARGHACMHGACMHGACRHAGVHRTYSCTRSRPDTLPTYAASQETSGDGFSDIALPGEVFLTDTVDERVALLAVQRRCTLLRGAQAAAAQGAGGLGSTTFICRFHYLETSTGPALQRLLADPA